MGVMGQWMFIVFLGSCIAHLSLSGTHHDVLRDGLLIVSATIFLVVDFLLFAIAQSISFGEPFFPILKSIIKEGIALEATQYFIAILGALAAFENMWSLALLVVPVVITYVAFKNLKETRFETIQILEDMADTVDLRDVYTGGHSKRVAALVRGILLQMEISGPEATIVEIAARLHDIGKIGIADSILKKPARLLPEEMATMRTHPEKGAELISKYKDFSRGAEMILYHHERWDGTGYPAGLKANEIPFGARVLAVADGFDAMTSDRTYRKALSTGQAVQILLDGRDTQWDSKVVMALLGYLSRQAADETAEGENIFGIKVPASLPGNTFSSR
jgi:HD-GYP domain-containing protein (c-di-GMP phosphodiesterase class II)